MLTQLDKARAFRALHERSTAFIIPNPWDIGSARLLAHAGFEALATTSAGAANAAGKIDTQLSRDDMLEHVATIASAVDLPVSGDLENGYGDSPEEVAQTVVLAAAAGLVGCSIEDASGRPDDPIYEISAAADRIRAATEAARALSFPFTLTARAENYLHGRNDLDDTIKRLHAYQEAGADVLYAPGLTRQDDIAAVVRSVDCPVNVLSTPQFTVAQLSQLGVRRISLGSTLARTAYDALLRAAREMRDHGTFNFSLDVISYRDLNAIFAKSSSRP